VTARPSIRRSESAKGGPPGDRRLAERIRAALGDAHTVVNVGAGAGAYEPAALRRLAGDLDSGEWERRNAACSTSPSWTSATGWW
jgi:hypothetical protein